jgi:hypothetical protein
MIIVKLVATAIILIMFLTLIITVLAIANKSICDWTEKSRLFDVMLKITIITILIVVVIYLLALIALGLWGIWT